MNRAEQYIVTKLKNLARRIDGRFKISLRGVPYVLVKRNGEDVSICWFGKKQMFRIFIPFGAPKQTRIDFKSSDDVASFLRNVETKEGGI